MTELQKLKMDIAQIKERNARVEIDKAWETSLTRKIIVAFLTYLVIVLFFVFARLPKPWLNALVPATGFILSTLSIPLFKKIWQKRQKKSAVYHGVIIEESLADKSVLSMVKIVSAKIKPVTPRHQTPWVSEWTSHTVEIDDGQAQEVAERISTYLDPDHAWYADFKNDTHHYIIFRDRIFFIDRASQKQYDEARDYGLSLGIPDYQVDFHT